MKLIFFIALTISSIGLLGAWKLLAVGDLGQADKWWEQNQKMKVIVNLDKTADTVGKANLKAKADEILREMTQDINLDSSDDETAGNIFKNFGKIYKCSVLGEEKIEQVVLLGDAIYPEHKGGLLKPAFFEQGDTFKDDTVLSTSDVLGKKRDYYFVYQGEFEKVTGALIKRVQYAAKKISEFLKNLGECGPTTPTEDIEVLPGNHTYDVDVDLENKEFDSNFSKANSNVPTLKSKTVEGVTVWYININLYELACLDAARFGGEGDELYKNCISAEKGSRYLRTPSQSKIYLTQLIARLVELKNKNADWRVARTHNPLFGPEVDFNAAFQIQVKYKCNGKDLNTIWNESIQGDVQCVEDPSVEAMPLTTVFQKSLIDFWMASHMHAASLLAARYNPQGYQNSIFNGSDLDQASGKRCINRFDEFFGLVANTENVTRPASAALETNECAADPAEKTIYLKKEAEQSFILTFIIGNSGRSLDHLKTDSKSNADIIFARSFTNSYADPATKKVSAVASDLQTYENTSAKVDALVNTVNNNMKSNFGWTIFDFKNGEVNVEFYELFDGAQTKTLTKKFVLLKKPIPDGKIHKIEKMPFKAPKRRFMKR